MKHIDRECGYCTEEEDYGDIISVVEFSCAINLVYSISMNVQGMKF